VVQDDLNSAEELLLQTQAQFESLTLTSLEKDEELKELRERLAGRSQSVRDQETQIATLRREANERDRVIEALRAEVTALKGVPARIPAEPAEDPVRRENARLARERREAEEALAGEGEVVKIESDPRLESGTLRGIVNGLIDRINGPDGRVTRNTLVSVVWPEIEAALRKRAKAARGDPERLSAWLDALTFIFVNVLSQTNLMKASADAVKATPAIGTTEIRGTLRKVLADLGVSRANKDFGQLNDIATAAKGATYKQIAERLGLGEPIYNNLNETLAANETFKLSASKLTPATSHGGPHKKKGGDGDAQDRWDRAFASARTTTFPGAQAVHLQILLDMLRDPAVSARLDIEKVRRNVTQLRIQFPTRSATSTVPLLIDSLVVTAASTGV
jgi:hypothetical protein